MDFNFSDEQVLLRDSLRAFLRARHPADVRHVPEHGSSSRRPDIWWGFAEELGILGAAVGGERGGLGGGPVEHMIIMEEIGRALVREPYLETIVIGAGILSRCGGETAAQTLTAALAGELLLAYAWAEPGMGIDLRAVATAAARDAGSWRLTGRKSIVTAAPWASHLLVLARIAGEAGSGEGLSLFLVEKSLPGVRCTDFMTLDGRWASEVSFEDVRVPAAMHLTDGDAYPIALEIADRAIAACCAEAVGIMTRLHEDTIAYIKQRRQFGTALSAFQVLRHRIADMLIQLEMATSGIYLATLSLSEPADQRALAVASAKVVVDDAGRFIGQNAIQLHGGMGMTDELAIGHYVKRLMTIGTDFGGADLHVVRYAELQRLATN
jgi:alkylation response protein AidB-like acyl-CoA dehydrogenase